MGCRRWTRWLLAAALASAPLPAAAEQAEREGVIESRRGNSLEIRTRRGPLTVIVSPGTRIRERGDGRRERDMSSLIPGLAIEVEGDLSGRRIAAERIDFRARDWRAAAANAAPAATADRRQPSGALGRATIDGEDYVIRDQATVFFASGLAAISPQHREELIALARRAPSFGDYRISIIGFTDPTGNRRANARLSLRRGEAVADFLRRTELVEPERMLAPAAAGEDDTAPGAAAPASNREARRVVVRIVTPGARHRD